MRGDIGGPDRVRTGAQMADEPRGLIHGYDPAGRPDDRGEIQRHEPRTATDVENGLARAETGAFPHVSGFPRPDSVLITETLEFSVGRAKNVFVGSGFLGLSIGRHGWCANSVESSLSATILPGDIQRGYARSGYTHR